MSVTTHSHSPAAWTSGNNNSLLALQSAGVLFENLVKSRTATQTGRISSKGIHEGNTPKSSKLVDNASASKTTAA
jgi:hypothetical protein